MALGLSRFLLIEQKPKPNGEVLSMNSGRKVLTALLIGATTFPAGAAETTLQTEANVVVELTLTASRNYTDPFNEVTPDVVFIDPHGQELRVPAFWAGKNLWKVRYASPVVGTHRFRSVGMESLDRGLHGVTGKVEVGHYRGQNPLYAHGPLQVSAHRRYLEHLDGTPFFWLGDTWWMGLCHRLRWPEDFKKLAADRKEKGFNVIQIVAGLYPDMHPFDPRGANEAGYPWETNYARIRPEYFDAADERLSYLVGQGFTPCIVGAWGYFMPWMGVEKAKQHWRYLIARYGALPVVWCAAGEANLPWYLAKGFPYDDRRQVKDWTDVMRYIRETDPFHRPLTIHPTGIGRLSARNATEDPALLDFDMLQTPHGQRGAVPPTVRTVRESYADKPVMPVINGEAAYEMLGDTLPTRWTRQMFWLCLMNGAAGHTYGANGIWQVNRRGQPHGPSPHHNGGVGYGKIPWDEAMHLPGSRQVALGKTLLEQYAWQNFQPHPEWAGFADKSPPSFDGGQWIWFPEGRPAENAPAGKRFFRKSFTLPEGKAIKNARLLISADNAFEARLNDSILGTGTDWQAPRQLNDVAPKLKPGKNVLTVMAENLPDPGANPAGLIAGFEIHVADGETVKVVTDATWQCSNNAIDGWDKASFDDALWTAAAIIGRYGDAPWGRIGPLNDDEVFAPQSTGIPGVVRIIYVPESEPIVVRQLDRSGAYAATWFDPESGAKMALPAVQADDAGLWKCSPPAGHDHDWVLILEEKTKAK